VIHRAFDRAEFELRRATFEDVLAPELTPEQRLREQRREGARATCPCCGYPTINGRGAFDICSLCGWEDDGQDDPERCPYLHAYFENEHGRTAYTDPSYVLGGPNTDYSLAEARENFAQYVTMYRPTDRDFERERAQTHVKRHITAAYDRAVDGEATFAEADAEARSLMDELH
jgi:Cysteine-rich CPCC